MNTKLYEEVKDFFFGLIIYIRPNLQITDYTPIGALELDEIDFTMIAIECEEKYQIIVDEKLISNSFFVNEVLEYLIHLIEKKEKNFCQVSKHY